MGSVFLAIDDVVVGDSIAQGLERAGLEVRRMPAAAALPDETILRGRQAPDVVVVDADAEGMDVKEVASAWGRFDPPPALFVLGSTAAARIAADKARAVLVPKPVDPAALGREAALAAAGPRDVASPTAARALAILGMEGGGLPDDEAAAILAGARSLDPVVVKDALKRHAFDYITIVPAWFERLCDRRALKDSEIIFAATLDGARTLKTVVEKGGLPAITTARLLWALVSAGAATLTREPPDEPGRPGAQAVAATRAHLRARRTRLVPHPGATELDHYDVLELDPEAAPADVDRAAQLMATRFAPDLMTPLDLGDLASTVEPLWAQIVAARATLRDPLQKSRYDAARLLREPDLEQKRMRRKIEAQEAEAAFVRGQRALGAGEIFRAVSELASAARRLPDEPDYEAYAAWARYLADEERGRDRVASAIRERAVAEGALAGRKPRPRALFAVGLLAEAGADLEGARRAFAEALACDPRLSPARKALARVQAAIASGPAGGDKA